ncbi:MAG: HupE/UreJ family protein [SAR324 cluster bacterium]|nr:HupE/UreJ family protein [SAR324 cluster bacterium]
MKFFSNTKLKTLLATLAFTSASGIALAHTNMLEHGGLLEGSLHPFTGMDHLLAMLVLGLWAVQRGGKQLWVLPLVFLSGMTTGLLSGIQGWQIPMVETGVAASVFILGVLISARSRLPQWTAMTLTVAFGFFHGQAHGSEIQPDSQMLMWSLGAIISAALLHGTGMGTGYFLKQSLLRKYTTALGGMTAFAGLTLIASTVA